MFFPKKSITANEFKSIMENYEYPVTDYTSEANYGDYVRKIYVAGNKRLSYQIEFYELADNQSASKAYEINVESLEAENKGFSSSTKLSRSNYDKYSATSNGKYRVVSRINNTFIFLNVDIQYKDNVEYILNELGY